MAGQFEQTGPSGTYIISSETGEVIIQTKAAKDIKFVCNIDGSLKGWRIDGTTGDFLPVGGSGINTALANNSYLQSIDAAGTGYDNLIKADSSDNTQIEAATGKTIKLGINGTAVATLSGSGWQLNAQKMFLNGNANTQIVPGSSSLSIRDAGDTTNEFLFSAGGALTIIGAIQAGGASAIDTSTNSYLSLKTSGSTKAIIGVSNAADSPIAGMAAGDLGLRVANKNFVVSTDGGSTIAFLVDASNRALIGSGSADTNSILTLTSTTKAVLLPRMTGAQRAAMAGTTTGMIVFDTDLDKLVVKCAGGWQAVTSV